MRLEDIRENSENINDVFAGIVMKCLEPDPGKRYQSSQELLTDLQNMSRKDKRYRSLLMKQRVEYGVTAAAALFFCVIAIYGYSRIGKDKLG